ncbi:MAG: GNAT family N-acetyltransferase [Chloroflexi bacterium]|nr:MAG: GNAT family N-acetyltransferase [Chloroflexota bacterium]
MSPNEFLIRPLHTTDTEKLHKIITHPVVTEMLLKMPSMEFSETAEWVEKQTPGHHRLIIEKEGEVIGYGTLTHEQNPRRLHAGNLSVVIHPDYWRQEAGTAVTNALLNIADNWLDLKRIQAATFTHNTAAINLFKKVGFASEGTRRMVSFGAGKWQDDHVMVRLRHTDALQPRTSPPPPRPSQTEVENTAVSIRPPLAQDIEGLHRLLTHPAVGRTTFQIPSTELSRIKERIEPRQPSLHRLVALVADEVVGNIVLWQNSSPRQSHIGHLGMMVDPAYWGMRIGSQLMDAILDIADNWLNLKRVELEVNTDNPAAVHLYQKFGFAIEGTKQFHMFGDGRWADSHFMGRIKE